MKATLQHIDGVTPSEFEATQTEYALLLACQENGTIVEVTCEDACIVDSAGDFVNNYHDIKLPSGQEFAAVAGFHLNVVEKS